MVQHSGFENRYINAHTSPVDFPPDSVVRTYIYASVDQNSIESDTLATSRAFPGVKSETVVSSVSETPYYSNIAFEFPILLLLALAAFVFLKNLLRCSFSHIAIMAVSPKLLPEAERRQIDRNQWAIRLLALVSCFLLTIILYGVIIRSGLFRTPFLALFGLPESGALPALSRGIIFVGCVVAMFGIYYFQQLFLSLLSYVFNIPKQIGEYRKNANTFLASFAPIGILIAACVLFMPENAALLVTLAGTAYLLALIASKVIIALRRVFSPARFGNIHIFLYLCTLEILSILIFVKFLI